MRDEWIVIKNLTSTSVFALFIADCYLVGHTFNSGGFLTSLWCSVFAIHLGLCVAVQNFLDFVQTRIQDAQGMHSRLEAIIDVDAMGIFKQDDDVIKALQWALTYWRNRPLPYSFFGTNTTAGFISRVDGTMKTLTAYLVAAFAIQVTRIFGKDVTIATLVDALLTY